MTEDVPDENVNPLGETKPSGKQYCRTILDYWKSFDQSQRRFGRAGRVQRSRTAGPIARLWRAMQNREPVLVVTRGLREPRASLHGRLVAFDRYWNLVLSDVTEYVVNLPKSSLSGHYKPSRSRKRRMQRLANQIKLRQGLIFQSTAESRADDDDEFWPRDREKAIESLTSDTLPGSECREAMETGDHLALTDPLPEPVSPSANTGTTSSAFWSLYSRTFQESRTRASAIGRRDCGTNTDNCRWYPSDAMVTERSDHLVTNSDPNEMTSTAGSADKVLSSETPEGQGLPSTPERHSQLFVRGANVIFINFMK